MPLPFALAVVAVFCLSFGLVALEDDDHRWAAVAFIAAAAAAALLATQL